MVHFIPIMMSLLGPPASAGIFDNPGWEVHQVFTYFSTVPENNAKKQVGILWNAEDAHFEMQTDMGRQSFWRMVVPLCSAWLSIHREAVSSYIHKIWQMEKIMRVTFPANVRIKEEENVKGSLDIRE